MADMLFVSRVTRTGRAVKVLLTSVMVLIMGLTTPLRADKRTPLSQPETTAPKSEEPSHDGSAADPGNAEHWLNKLARFTGLGQEPSPHARSHPAVLNAFRPAVSLPAKSTVKVLCRDSQVALGVIIDSDGYIATKASELSGAVFCELADGTRHAAELVGMDRGSDLGLLKISALGLPTIRWSEDDPPSVGGWVITPGTGDVPQAIGIVSVAPHRVRGGVLGIQMTEDEPGPRITFVVPGSGAAAAGLARGDVITHVNGQRMANSSAMVAMTSNSLPGDKLEVTLLRDREEQKIVATVGSVASTLTSRRARFQDQLGGPLSKRSVLFPSALEHDSVLDPHECGGALVNLDGKAIGVNIARASRISSFAIPAGVVRPILDSLKSQASESRATLSVSTRAAPRQAPRSTAEIDLESTTPLD